MPIFRKELRLGETEFAVLVALPVLTGSVLRLPVGLATDRFGGRPLFTVLLASSAIPLLLLTQATAYWQHLVLGLFIGLAGTSRSEEHTSELQSLMRISYAVFC